MQKRFPAERMVIFWFFCKRVCKNHCGSALWEGSTKTVHCVFPKDSSSKSWYGSFLLIQCCSKLIKVVHEECDINDQTSVSLLYIFQIKLPAAKVMAFTLDLHTTTTFCTVNSGVSVVAVLEERKTVKKLLWQWQTQDYSHRVRRDQLAPSFLHSKKQNEFP